MPLNLLSFFLSFFINLFFLTLLIFALFQTPLKKEDIKISLLEPQKSYELTQEVERHPKENTLPKPVKPSLETSKVVSRLAPSLEPSLKTKQTASPLKAKSTVKNSPSEKPLDEGLLKKRLFEIEKKVKTQESDYEENFLKNKIASLGKKKTSFSQAENNLESSEKTSSASERVPSPSQKISEEYLLLIKRRLQTHFEIPIYLKNKGNLSVVVEIETNAEGYIKKINYLKKSQDETFNKSVEKCLFASNPLPVSQPIKLKVEFRSEGRLIFN
jgi:colicin import membrane protein